jgi:hypothetical protein
VVALCAALRNAGAQAMQDPSAAAIHAYFFM